MPRLSAFIFAVYFICSSSVVRAARAEGVAEDVRAAESAFASSMARRDFSAFEQSVSSEAIFFADTKVLRGKSAVLAEWKSYFAGPTPPFAWEAEIIEVLDSGKLALSSGPVLGKGGKLIARFNSIWRLENDGKWRIVFDKGEDICK